MQKKSIQEIRKIVKKLKKLDTNRLTQENKKFNDLMTDYLRRTQLIVTGQKALEALLPDTVQPDPLKNYYEIISDHPHQQRNEIADMLVQNGFEDVQRINYGKLPVIKIKHLTRVEMKYASPKLYQTIDTREIGGVRYTSEIMEKIDIYSQFTDPANSIQNWKELYQVNLALNHKFHLEAGNKVCFVQPDQLPKDTEWRSVRSLIYTKFMQDNENIVIVGLEGYRQLVQASGILRERKCRVYCPHRIKYYEVLSLDIKSAIKTITELLAKNGYQTGLVIKKSGATLNYHGPKWSIYYRRHKVIDLYDSRGECIPFTVLNKMTIGSFHLILKYLYIGLWVAKKQIHNKLVEQKNWCLINNLIKTRSYYLLTKNKIGLEPGPFKIFHTLCVGTREDIKLQQMEDTWEYQAKKFRKLKNRGI